MELVGFRLEMVEAGLVEGFLEPDNKHLQQFGIIHGGVVATLADVVSGFAAYTLVGEDHHVVTAEIKISYLQKGRGESLQARGWVVKPGKNLIFCEAEIWENSTNDADILLAKSTSSMSVISADKKK